jgi:hypothetical protein
VHRKEQRPGVAGLVEAAEDLFRRGAQAVGIVLADVRVGVEPLDVAQALAAAQQERAQDRVEVAEGDRHGPPP